MTLRWFGSLRFWGSGVWLLGMVAFPVCATDRYVVVDNPNAAPPYTNWITAAANIQDAIDAAAPGDNVFVSNGVYQAGGRVVAGSLLTNRVVVDKPITVQSMNGALVSTIHGKGPDGNDAVRCIWMTNGATLIGFTLTNGATRAEGTVATEQSGGGLWAQSTNAIISNCILTGNSAMREGGGARGGTLNQCKLIGNTARVSSGGGAIYSTLNNCTLTGNHAGFDGGGAGNSTLNQCFVTDNTAIFGGGAIYSTLSQCVLIGNSVSESGGGAIFCTLTSCTLAGNSAGNNGGGSVDGTLKNCIVYFNDAPDHPNHIDLMLDHTCTTPLPPGGVGNITNNPMFIDLAATNLQLSAGSPARDTGNNVNAPAGPDLAGNARIVNGYVDMGAYEFQGSPQGDYDGDGIGNGDERVAGTDFTDEHDVFGVADVTSGGITFDSVTGRVYAVEFNENLLVVPQVWTEFTNGIPGTGSAIMIHDPDDATNRNYRVRVKLP